MGITPYPKIFSPLPRFDRDRLWRCARAGHAKVGCALEAAAGTSHHGPAPKERGFWPVQCTFIGCGAAMASPA